jgi:hypothetical protein
MQVAEEVHLTLVLQVLDQLEELVGVDADQVQLEDLLAVQLTLEVEEEVQEKIEHLQEVEQEDQESLL